MTVLAVGTGQEAVDLVRQDPRPDIALIDHLMPDMDGGTLAAALEQASGQDSLPVIMVSSIGSRSPVGHNVVAWLNKPVKPSPLLDALHGALTDIGVEPPTGDARAEEAVPLGERHPLRILLAEDNAVNQKLALRLLQQQGYSADVAANGLEVIEALEGTTFDLVFMDVHMPALDGIEATRRIRRRWPGAAGPRIVAMTAAAMAGDRERCLTAGMDGYIAKPIRVAELLAALEQTPARDVKERSRA
jgi:CheY-like chemotaxis protein